MVFHCPSRLSSCLKTLNNSHFLFFIIENAACQTDTKQRGWCDVKVENLMSLEEVKEQRVDGSKTYNFSICMDRSVAKSLFKAECLHSPLISEKTLWIFKVAAIVSAIVVIVIPLTVVVLLFRFPRHKRKCEPTPQEA